MTVVVYGHCPDCRTLVAIGACCYTYDAYDSARPGGRVVPCKCGSRKRPV